MAFYAMRDAGKRFVDIGEGNDWEGVVCPRHPGHQRAGLRVTELRIDVIPKSVVDFSWTILGDIVVTDHALLALEEARLTGFQFKPTVLTPRPSRQREREFPRLWEFIVTGKGGHVHPDTGTELLEKCDTCGHVRYSAFQRGIIVDDSQWDGSDFFTVTEYPREVLIGARAKEVLEQARLTNLKIIEAIALQW